MAVMLSCMPGIYFAQAPSLGTAANFVLFTSSGSITNTGISHLTGNVGTNSGSITGFGNVNGDMLSGNGETGQCAADLLSAYNVLDTMTPGFFPAVLLGNGDTLVEGVYSVSAASTLNGTLYLDAENNANAEFVIQIEGTFGSAAGSEIVLLNGAQACNVFWKIEGMVTLAAGTNMKGNIIVNNAAVSMSTNDTIEGRVFTTTGAITLDGTMAYTPVGCGSPVLTGPAAPAMGTAACYVVFSADGGVTNAGVTTLVGDVGTNVGLTTGFDSLTVTGEIHPIPDASTAAAAADLLTAYTYLNGLAHDIELLYPAQFGNNLVLTPHTYLMNSAVTFTDSLYLNAMGDSNAVFVIKVYGALSTSTYARVLLINGAKADNVYWMISGAVDLNDYTEFKGTIVCNNGAMDLNTGVNLEGRALTTTGALNTTAITATMTDGCGSASITNITTQPLGDTVCAGDSVSFFVAATGVGLTYQWRKGNVNLINNANISGVTTDTLTIDPASTKTGSNLFPMYPVEPVSNIFIF